MIRNLIAIILISLEAITAYSQEVPENREKTPFYYMQQIGVNYSLNENTRFGSFSDPIGVSATFEFGKEFTPLWGWRTMLGYNMNRGRSSWKSDAYPVRFHNLELFADGTLDLTDWWFPNRTRKAFNLKGFLGVGYLQTFAFSDSELAIYADYTQESRAIFGFRGGVNASYKIVENFAVCIDASLSCMQDNFNGVVNKRSLDGRINLGIGCIWFFGKRKNSSTSVTPVQLPNVVEIKERVVIVPKMAYVTPNSELEKRRIDSGSAYLDFPVSEMRIYPAYRRNPMELKRIRESIDIIKNDTMVTITAISIHGYASPEGSYRSNALLALGRTLALKEYLQSLYRFEEAIFTVESTPEDWSGLRKYVQESTMPDKEALLKIIDSPIDPDLKNKRLQSVAKGDPYRFLLKEVYPTLRHSDYTVHYTIREFSIEEGRKILRIRPQLLSLNEMFLVANSYGEGTKEYKETFKIAVQIYPDDPVANLNAACIALENKNILQAKSYLEKAGNTPAVTHARGVIAVMEGDYELARILFMQSSEKGIPESTEMLMQLP